MPMMQCVFIVRTNKYLIVFVDKR